MFDNKLTSWPENTIHAPLLHNIPETASAIFINYFKIIFGARAKNFYFTIQNRIAHWPAKGLRILRRNILVAASRFDIKYWCASKFTTTTTTTTTITTTMLRLHLLILLLLLLLIIIIILVLRFCYFDKEEYCT